MSVTSIWNRKIRTGVLCTVLALGMFAGSFAEGKDYILTPDDSIAICLKNAAPGDRCLLKAGRYQEQILLRGIRGKPGAPISLMSVPGEEAVLDGSLPLVGNWQKDGTLKDGGTIWKLKTDFLLWQVLRDDKAMELARFPNAKPGEPHYWLQQESWRHMTARSTPGIAHDERPKGEDNVAPPQGNYVSLADLGVSVKGAVAIMNIGSWITVAQFVDGHKAGSGTFTYSMDFSPMGNEMARDMRRKMARPGWWEKKNQRQEQAYYLLIGHRALLDEVGEWHYDKDTSTVYVGLGRGETPHDMHLSGKVMDYAVTLEKSRYVRIEGLSFVGAGVRVKDSDHVTVAMNDFLHPSFGRWVLGDLRPARPIRFDSKARKTSANQFVKNRVIRPDGPGLWLNGKGDLIEDNLFLDSNYYCAGPLRWSVIAFSGSRDTVLRHNTVKNGGCSSGIVIGKNTLAALNLASGTGMMQHDGSVFHTIIPAQKDTLITQNWVFDARRGGYRFDAPMNGSKWGHGGSVVKNVSWNTEKSIIKGEDHQVIGNTAFDSKMPADITVFNSPDHAGHNKNTVVTNNLAGLLSGLVGKAKSLANDSGGNLSGVDVKSLLRDPANRDFRPRDTRLIDQGVAVEGIAYIGAAPDIGAYEAGAKTYWIPGRREAYASHPIPMDGNVAKHDADLIWRKAWDAVRYRVWFGTGDRLSMIKEVLDSNIVTPPELKPGAEYNWRVDAVKPDGSVVQGKLWHFTVQNEKPENEE